MSMIDYNLDPMDRRRHGGLYDRGGADSWYSRARSPHYYASHSERVVDLTDEQVAEYNAGYDENEKSGGKKDWT